MNSTSNIAVKKKKSLIHKITEATQSGVDNAIVFFQCMFL